MSENAYKVQESLSILAEQLKAQAEQVTEIAAQSGAAVVSHEPFIVTGLTVFVLACFVGYYVVWRVTPALHSPLMGVSNAISSVIIVGAILATGAHSSSVFSSVLGFLAVIFASVNIFGGFIITQRMLHMFKKKG